MKFFILLIGVFILPNTVFAHEAAQVDQVSVVGFGEIKAEPDQVTLAVSVYAIEQDLETAKRVADMSYQTVLDKLKELEVKDTNIKVVRMDMRPEYEWTSNQRVYKGERVNRSLSIVIDDLSKVSSVLQGLVEEGVSTMDNMSAGFKDEAKIKREALEQAVADAKGKAAFLAEQVDRKLGVAFNIVEQNNGGPVFQNHNMARANTMQAESYTPPEEMFGTQTITANITIAFRLD